MKTLPALIFILGIATRMAATEGWLTYQNTEGVGKEKYIFGIDAAAPNYAQNGGVLSDYAPRAKCDGAGYWAELWYAQGSGLGEQVLKPVPGSRVEFRTGTTAGLIKGIARLSIPGTCGGDHVTLQLRVWDNRGGTMQTWEDALTVNHGKSNLIADFVLSGLDANGTLVFGDGNISKKLEYFGVVIPEPSFNALIGIGALALTQSVRRVRRRRPLTHAEGTEGTEEVK